MSPHESPKFSELYMALISMEEGAAKLSFKFLYSPGQSRLADMDKVRRLGSPLEGPSMSFPLWDIDGVSVAPVDPVDRIAAIGSRARRLSIAPKTFDWVSDAESASFSTLEKPRPKRSAPVGLSFTV